MIENLEPFNFANLFTVYILFLLVTCHACLFFDLSKFNKKQTKNRNFISASFISALIPTMAYFNLTFSGSLKKYSALTAITLISAILLSYGMQFIFKSDIAEIS